MAGHQHFAYIAREGVFEASINDGVIVNESNWDTFRPKPSVSCGKFFLTEAEQDEIVAEIMQLWSKSGKMPTETRRALGKRRPYLV